MLQHRDKDLEKNQNALYGIRSQVPSQEERSGLRHRFEYIR